MTEEERTKKEYFEMVKEKEISRATKQNWSPKEDMELEILVKVRRLLEHGDDKW